MAEHHLDHLIHKVHGWPPIGHNSPIYGYAVEIFLANRVIFSGVMFLRIRSEQGRIMLRQEDALLKSLSSELDEITGLQRTGASYRGGVYQSLLA